MTITKPMKWGIGIGVVVLIGILSQCGGSDGETSTPKTMKPAQVEVKGDLKGCYEVVDREYKINSDGYSRLVSVELKRTDKELPFSVEEIDVFDNEKTTQKTLLVGFGIEMLDSIGDVIDVRQPTMSSYSDDDILSILNLKPGDTGIIRWSVDGSPVKFRITSIVKTHDPSAVKEDLFDKAVDKILEEDDESKEDAAEDENLDEDLKNAEKAMDAAQKVLETEKELFELLK